HHRVVVRVAVLKDQTRPGIRVHTHRSRRSIPCPPPFPGDGDGPPFIGACLHRVSDRPRVHVAASPVSRNGLEVTDLFEEVVVCVEAVSKRRGFYNMTLDALDVDSTLPGSNAHFSSGRQSEWRTHEEPSHLPQAEVSTLDPEV